MAFLISAVTAHVPNHRQKYINAYGHYSNKTRGLLKKHTSESEENDIAVQEPNTDQKQFRKTWAMLLRKVWVGRLPALHGRARH